MLRGERIVSDKLDVRGKNINQLARWYFNDELFVNRKYQRKLVWSLDEKILFIDSIINKFPTPSIMINDVKEKIDGVEFQRYEIIDGLQRLDAIFSFIKGEFAIKYDGKMMYFNLMHIPTAAMQLHTGQLVQNYPVLPSEVCSDFADSELPVILSGQGERKIEEIFRRINSSGKKLSTHDLRQAGATDDFAELVRKIACRVRGDYTYTDSVMLRDMPKISVSSHGLRYGIKSDSVFWRRHDIITHDNLRRSKDEEIIASILAHILIGDDFHTTLDNLEKLYVTGSEYNKTVLSEIRRIGFSKLEKDVYDIFCEIDKIFQSVNSTFTSWLFTKKKSPSKDVGLKLLVLALYRAHVDDYVITDYTAVADILKSRSETTFRYISQKNTKHFDRMNVLDILYQSLVSVMRKQLPREENELEPEICRLLSLSPIESCSVEFKVGVLFFENGNVNMKCVQKIAKTLVAMANTEIECRLNRCVIVGVANDEQTVADWENCYNKKAFRYGQHFITGVSAEAIRRFGKLDKYFDKVYSLLQNEPISADLKKYVLNNMQLVSFKDTVLLFIPSMPQESVSLYNGKRYVRKTTNTVYETVADPN